MFRRQVTLKLKPDAAVALTRIVSSEIVPILQQQKGFRDETIFVAPERSEAIAGSFWETPEDAEAYSQSAYPQVLTALANLIEEIPTVKPFDFVTSTIDPTFCREAGVTAASFRYMRANNSRLPFSTET